MLLLAIVDKYIFILLLLISCCCFTVWPQEWRTAMRIWTFQRRWSCLLFLASPYLLKRSPGEVRGYAATSRIGSDLPVKPHTVQCTVIGNSWSESGFLSYVQYYGSGTIIPDPDPSKSSGSMRIWIRNTAKNIWIFHGRIWTLAKKRSETRAENLIFLDFFAVSCQPLSRCWQCCSVGHLLNSYHNLIQIFWPRLTV